MRNLLLLLAVLAIGAPAGVSAQELAEVRNLYHAGEYGEAARVVAEGEAGGEVKPRLLFVQAHAHERLNETDAARAVYGRLASGEFGEAWQLIGQSAAALLQHDMDTALRAAEQAAAVSPGLAEAHYQLGTALGHRNEFERSAAAFQRATEIDPADAYAHYYAGLAFSRIQRVDRTAIHFEAFLKLAPDAPERPEVLSIMRTLRGR